MSLYDLFSASLALLLSVIRLANLEDQDSSPLVVQTSSVARTNEFLASIYVFVLYEAAPARAASPSCPTTSSHLRCSATVPHSVMTSSVVGNNNASSPSRSHRSAHCARRQRADQALHEDLASRSGAALWEQTQRLVAAALVGGVPEGVQKERRPATNRPTFTRTERLANQ